MGDVLDQETLNKESDIRSCGGAASKLVHGITSVCNVCLVADVEPRKLRTTRRNRGTVGVTFVAMVSDLQASVATTFMLAPRRVCGPCLLDGADPCMASTALHDDGPCSVSFVELCSNCCCMTQDTVADRGL